MKKIIITSIGTVVFAMALFFNVSLDNSKLNNKDFNLGSLITIAYAQQGEVGSHSPEEINRMADLYNQQSYDQFLESKPKQGDMNGGCWIWCDYGTYQPVVEYDKGFAIKFDANSTSEVKADLVSRYLANAEIAAGSEVHIDYSSGVSKLIRYWECVGDGPLC